ncbi:hypothetical protein EVJ50_03770 [Synechococcus sp. RSCCF101]|uniref:hypothetical protein n=1 Tax=Synechococcus sp. RSCCF101 TaxID=2511069 RepID=UPI001247974E|nr:hypothetical protein [Synechococcus sp. RSCCF101]QEY31497.1 hypothetical protein EVJ50_03770 [Synechococcus sp. RSCCF101]
MLPGPSSRPVRQLLRWASAIGLSLLLTACGGPGDPPRAVVLQALALQIELTQTSIADALRLDAEGAPVVSRVRLSDQEVMRIDGAAALHLSGQFDWRLPGDAVRVNSPFDLVLTRGEKRQSWRLARPLPMPPAGQGERAWRTYPLPLPGET